MKSLKISLITLASLFAGSNMHGAAGIFDSLLWTTTTSPLDFGQSTFYNVDPTANLFGSAEFHGANLGTFETTDSLFIWSEQKSFKNNGTDVTAHTLHFEVRDSGNIVVNSGSFSMGFGSDLGGGDQMWRSAFTGSTDSSNVIASLAAGTYTLAVWTSISTNSIDAAPVIFNNRGGDNYVATLTVIPEPSTYAALAGAGLLLLVGYRRFRAKK